jgi:hypothetical protein
MVDKIIINMVRKLLAVMVTVIHSRQLSVPWLRGSHVYSTLLCFGSQFKHGKAVLDKWRQIYVMVVQTVLFSVGKNCCKLGIQFKET